MELEELNKRLQEDDLNFNLYFTRRLRNGNYVSFSPNIDAQIFDDLLNLINEYLKKFEDKDIVQYDPTGYKDGTIEAQIKS